MICPHSATAVAYYDHYPDSSVHRKVYIIATASPFKFPESCEEAGISSHAWNGYKLRDSLQGTPKITPLIMAKNQDWYQMLQSKIDEILNKIK